MKFIITLNPDNAAFDEDLGDCRRILAEVADQINYRASSGGGSVRDSNGNTVCTWTSEED